jgi:hypothetical protein
MAPDTRHAPRALRLRASARDAMARMPNGQRQMLEIDDGGELISKAAGKSTANARLKRFNGRWRER